MRSLTTVVVVIGLVAVSAYGDYTLTPQVGGQAIGTVVGYGGTFALDLLLTSDANDAHYASLFTVEFSSPGLVYEGYSWGSPYETGGVDDWSEPGLGSLPVVLDANTYEDAPGFDPGTIDVYLENVVPLGTDPTPIDDPFTVGTLVTLSLRVPDDYPVPALFITAVPDTFDDGSSSINTTGGAAYLIVPAIFGDASRSGLVDDADLSILLAHWGHTGEGWGSGNFNHDNIVDDADLSILLAHWGEATPSPPPGAPIPEPATLGLLGIGALIAIRRRRA